MFVILHYFLREPVEVYGTFASAEQAYKYAQQQGFDYAGAYSIHEILNIEETAMNVYVVMETMGGAPEIYGIYKRLEDAQRVVDRAPGHRWIRAEELR